MKKFLSLCLALCLALALLVPVSAAEYDDVPEFVGDMIQRIVQGDIALISDDGSFEMNFDFDLDDFFSEIFMESRPGFDNFTDVKGHWAEDTLRWAYDNQLFSGVSSTRFNPDGTLTRGHMATVITNAFGATKTADISMFIDISPDDWCYEAIAKAINMGFLSGFGNAIVPNEYVTREEVAVSLAKVAGFRLGTSARLGQFSDAAEVSPYARDYMEAAVANGILSGYKDGTLRPKATITRAQFAKMMQNLAAAYMNENATFTSKEVHGSLAVSIPNLRLDNMHIYGNLFIADGVDQGEITLSNTRVDGTIFVRGTGSGGLHLYDGSYSRNVVLNNGNNAVFLDIDDASSVGGVTVANANGSVTMTGDVGNVNLLTGKAPVKLTAATVDSLYIDGKSSAVTSDKVTTIRSIITTANSIGSALDLAGSVGDLQCAGDNSTIRAAGTLTSLSFGASVQNVSLTLPTTGKMNTVDLSVDNINVTLGGTIKRLNISGDKCDVKLAANTEVTELNITGDEAKLTVPGDAKIDTLTIRGDDVVVDFASGCSVKNVDTYGDDIKLTSTGKEDIKTITVREGDTVHIVAPGTVVRNVNGKNVIIGEDYELAKGDSITLDSKGTGDADDEEAAENPISSKKFSVTVNYNNGGSVTPASSTTVTGGTSQTFTIVCESGYVVSSFKVNGSAKALTPDTNSARRFTYELKNITADITIDVVFAEDPTAGGYHEPDGTIPTVNLRYPASAMPSDFGFDSAYALSDFGTFAFDSNTNKASGTAAYIPNFKWYTESNTEFATGYYMPLVMVPSHATNYGRLMIGDAVFGKEVISAGATLKNAWIAYVPLDPFAANKTITVAFDPDGDGAMFAAAKVTVDYSNVRFAGGVGSDVLYRGIKPLPGQDGGETAKIAFGVASSMTEALDIRLATEALLQTRNSAGRYGNWTGLLIPVLTGADGARLDITYPDNTTETQILRASQNSGFSVPVLAWEVNAGGPKITGNKTVRINIQWRNGLEDIATAEGKKSLNVDLSEVMLATSNGTAPMPGDASLMPVASLTSARIPTDVDLANAILSGNTEVTLDDFGVGLAVSTRDNGSAIVPSGMLFQLGSAKAASLGGKYAVPVLLEFQANTRINVMAGAKTLWTMPDGSDSGLVRHIVFVLVEQYGSGASDLTLTLQSATASMNYSSVNITVDCAALTLFSGGLIFDSNIPVGTIDGRDSSAYISGSVNYTALQNGRVLSVSGLAAKQADFTFGNTTGNLWLVPVSLFVKVANPTWSLEVTTEIADLSKTYTAADANSSGHLNILVPVMLNGDRLLNQVITLKDGEQNTYQATITFVGDYADTEL